MGRSLEWYIFPESFNHDLECEPESYELRAKSFSTAINPDVKDVNVIDYSIRADCTKAYNEYYEREKEINEVCY